MSPARRKKATPKKKATATKKPTRKAPKKTTAARKATKKTARKTSKKTAARAGATRKPARKTAAKRAKRTTASRTARKPAPAARAPQPRRRVRPAKFDRKQLAAIRQKLLEEQEDLRKQHAELEEGFEGSQSETTGEVNLDEDFADAGSATFERERDLSIQENIRDLVDQIERAIARIDEGKYGTCERCGNPIDAARLKALPHALLCMDCKRRDERAR